jgi:hypothetical protein
MLLREQGCTVAQIARGVNYDKDFVRHWLAVQEKTGCAPHCIDWIVAQYVKHPRILSKTLAKKTPAASAVVKEKNPSSKGMPKTNEPARHTSAAKSSRNQFHGAAQKSILTAGGRSACTESIHGR